MQCSASLLPLPLPPRQQQCALQRSVSAEQPGHTQTHEGPVGGGQFLRPPLSTLSSHNTHTHTRTSSSVDGPHSHWCFMFNSGSTQLHLEPPQLITAFHFYAKTRRCSLPAIPHIQTYVSTFTTRQLPSKTKTR